MFTIGMEIKTQPDLSKNNAQCLMVGLRAWPFIITLVADL